MVAWIVAGFGALLRRFQTGSLPNYAYDFIVGVFLMVRRRDRRRRHGERGESVHAALPLAAAARALHAYDGRGFETTALVAALGSATHTDLVHVRDGQSEIKVWIW